MVTETDIIEALKECYDPEIPINLVDLGLIYDVKIEGERVAVKMTLTMRGCPMHSTIAQQVKERLLKIPNIKEAHVEVVWDPPWNQEMMSEEGKKRLGIK